MFLNDLSLVRADASHIVADGNLPTVVLSTWVTKVEKITLEALKSIDLGDLSIFKCRLNRGIDAVVAIEFSNMFKEPSGSSTIDINFRCDPQKGEAVLQRVERAVTEIDGLWQFPERYFCPDFWSTAISKPVILEHWLGKDLQHSYHIKSLVDIIMSKDEPWAKDQLKSGSYITMRHTAGIEDHSAFTRIGYAEFFKCDLPIIMVRVCDLLFLKNAAAWVDLVEYVLLRPTKECDTVQVPGTQTFEILVAFRNAPQIDKLCIQYFLILSSSLLYCILFLEK